MYHIEEFKQINNLERIAITRHSKKRMEERGVKYVVHGMWS
jgi:hypothetical protein